MAVEFCKKTTTGTAKDFIQLYADKMHWFTTTSELTLKFKYVGTAKI